MTQRLKLIATNLETAKIFGRFDSEVIELLDWIAEKTARLARADLQQQSLSFEEKLHQLHKQQAMEVELKIQSPRIQELKEKLDQIQRVSDLNSRLVAYQFEIVERGNLLLQHWSDLNRMIMGLNAMLKEAKDLFDLNQAVQRVFSYIHEKELILAVEDTGRDLEHCQSLVDRVSRREIHGDSVDSSTVEVVNVLGERLIKQGSDFQGEIRGKLDKMNSA